MQDRMGKNHMDVKSIIRQILELYLVVFLLAGIIEFLIKGEPLIDMDSFSIGHITSLAFIFEMAYQKKWAFNNFMIAFLLMYLPDLLFRLAGFNVIRFNRINFVIGAILLGVIYGVYKSWLRKNS